MNSLFISNILRLKSIINNNNYYFKSLNKTSHHLSQFNINFFGNRFLFTNEFLGIDKYVNDSKDFRNNYRNKKDLYFERMLENTESETKLIFTQDLKNVMFLIENTENDWNLLTKMVKKYNSHNQSLRFGVFSFGPQVMRVCHHLGNSDLVFTLFTDPELKEFFNQLTSFTIGLDLLFKHKRYEEVIELFDYIRDNFHLHTKYPIDCILLFIASSYKINTAESFERALELFKQSQENGAKLLRKCNCLLSALALNQNQANIALEILSPVSHKNDVIVKNLILSALSDVKRFDEIFTLLESMLLDSRVERDRALILEQTLNKIKTAINETNDEQLFNKFSQIEKKYKEKNYIQTKSLDDLLTTPVTLFIKDFHQQKGFPGRQMSRNFRNNGLKSRPGLMDYDLD